MAGFICCNGTDRPIPMPRLAPVLVRCGLAVVSGGIYALTFPPYGWRWMIVPGVVGLLLALRGQRGSGARAIGFLHGMAAYGFALAWMWLLFGFFAIALWAILAAFTAAFAWMQGRAEAHGLAGARFARLTVVNWCGWEFIRAELFPLKFPWMTAGLAVGPNALLPGIGVYGVSALVVLACALLAWKPLRSLPVLALVFWFMARQDSRRVVVTAGTPECIHVAGLQYEEVSFKKYLDATKALPREIDHIVWPEYALPYDVRANAADWRELQNLCRERNCTLTVGTRTMADDGMHWLNTALTLDALGVRGEHHKIHTVHFFEDGTPGSYALPVPTTHGKVGTPICFDCDYEGVVRRMTKAGAEAFIVPMMDAVSWSRKQHVQHAELFRIRACESGRWFFVCGTSGVSQVIDPLGHVHGSLPPMDEGVLTAGIHRESGLTVYTRWGWLVPWGLLTAAILHWIVLLLPPRAAMKTSP
jgi:apolipoprotein N-acyltransferase